MLAVVGVMQYENQLRRNRGGYRTINTQLVSIHETHTFEHLEDFMNLLPDGLPAEFTTADISNLGKISRSTAQQMAYCLRKAGTIDEIGKTKEGKKYVKREFNSQE